MSLHKALLAEYTHETQSTRKVLERVPTDHFSWQPHEKSMSLLRLARHVADLAEWVTMIITQSELDLSVKSPAKEISSTEALVKYFDEKVETAKKTLAETNDEVLEETWTLRMGDHVIFSMPKKIVIRTVCFNHTYHHRGQLTVYLRLLGVALPNIYGPTADEQ